MRLLTGVLLLLALHDAPRAGAQNVMPPPTPQDSTVAPAVGADTGLSGLVRTPAGAFAASLVVPGTGQAALGARRWVAYGALELASWAVRLHAQKEQRDATMGYRDLAWEVARLKGDAPRRDGSWGYYETMTTYVRSGAFDRDPSAEGIQPENDPGTYNGSVWLLARALYLPDGAGGAGTAGYEQALAYYSAHAAEPDLLWSWEGNEGSMERFRALIGDADAASRTAGLALGAVLANHVVSAVDALIIARLRMDTGVRLESRLIPADPLRWSVALRIPIQDKNGRFR